MTAAEPRMPDLPSSVPSPEPTEPADPSPGDGGPPGPREPQASAAEAEADAQDLSSTLKSKELLNVGPPKKNAPVDSELETVASSIRGVSSPEVSPATPKHSNSSMRAIRRVTTVDLAANGFSWLTNPQVCWRHPIARILVAWLILVLDMYLFGEDPVNDSHVECNLPGLGHMYVFLLVWPSSAGLAFLRLALLVISIVAGAYIGHRWVHHRLLRDCCGLEMFNECNGTWLIMGLCCSATFFIGCMVYNLILTSEPENQITGATGMQMRTFAKVTQICSVTADLIAILMVTDNVFQDRTHYPRWAPRLKWLWMEAGRGMVRIIVIWLIAISGVSLTVWGILNTGKDADDFQWNSRHFGGLTETARALVMSCVVFCDIFTVVQDWQFPTFASPMDIPLDQQAYIAGTWVREINCNCLSRCAQRCSSCLPSLPRCGCFANCVPDFSFLHVKITGAWLTYGPLLVVMCIDLFCTRTQLIYDPKLYGQYVDPVEQQIWTILDEAYLEQVYNRGALREEHEDMITYGARRNVTTGLALSASADGDIMLNSRYADSSLKYLAAAPGFILMVVFFILVWAANRRRTLLISVASFMSNASSMAGSAARTVGNAIVRPISNSLLKSGAANSEETSQDPASAPQSPACTAWTRPTDTSPSTADAIAVDTPAATRS